MAQSAFRSWIGVAKDTQNANLSAAVAAGATSLTLKNITAASSTVGATYSVVIVDGVLTETVIPSGTISGVTDGSTLAIAATANAHSANAYVYFQLTASVGPTAYMPVTSMDFSDDYVQLYDKGMRGSQADIYGAQQGTRVGNISLAGDIFPDTFGYLLSSFFGAYDYTATAGIVPTQYAFSPQNTGNGQPSSYLYYDYNPGASNTRVYAKAVCSDLAIKFAPGALAGYTATIKSFASGVVNNPATIPPAFSSFTPLPARTATASIGKLLTGASSVTTANTVASTSGLAVGMLLSVVGGTGAFAAGTTVASITDATHFVSSAAASPALSGATVSASAITGKVMTADYSFKRQAFGEIFTLQGVQDPLAIFSGPVAASVKTSIIVDDDVQLLNYINQSQPSFSLTARIGQGAAATDNGVAVQTSVVNYEAVKVVQHGKAYVTLDVPFQAIANATDKTTAGGGLSPALVTLSTKVTGTSTLY